MKLVYPTSIGGRRAYPRDFGESPYPQRVPFRVEYAVDFRAVGSQTFSSDTDYTIDGKTWSAVNTANVDTSSTIGSAGIQMVPAANTVFDHATKDAPYLQVTLDQLVEDLDYSDRLVLQVMMEAPTFTNADQATAFQIGSTQQFDDDFDGGVGYANDGTDDVVRVWQIWGGSTNTGDAVMALPPVVGLDWQAPAYTPLSHDEAIWPNPGGMSRVFFPLSASNSNPKASTWPWSESTIVLRLWAERPSGASAFTATFTGLRVLRQRI